MRTVLLPKVLSRAVCVLLAAASCVVAQDRSRGPSGWFHRMDRNHNGLLEPNEIDDRARGYLERFAREAGLDMRRPMPIARLDEAMRRRQQNSSGSSGGSRPTPSVDDSIPGFGHVDDLPPVLGFGVDAESLAYVEQEDIDKAVGLFRRYDPNHDGYIDRNESRQVPWREDPLQFDRNHDGRLTVNEMAERYSKQRIIDAGGTVRGYTRRPYSDSRSESQQRAGEEESRRRQEEERRQQEERRRREEYSNRGTWSLVGSLIGRYDTNHNQKLEADEWRNMGVSSPMHDTNEDGSVDRPELYRWVTQQAAESSSPPPPPGLPDWFGPRDVDSDGQVVMAEFSQQWDDDTMSEFARFDLNQDGVIVPDECLKVAAQPTGAYANNEFQIIPARGVIYSRISVHDATPIRDLNVQLSITHTHDDALDVFLIDPSGQKIELFTGVGGSDDHFDNTILDDEARWPIEKARPPFRGTFQPEARTKNQPSLSQYRGQSLEGDWTLMVRAERSDREGALHGWSMLAQPADQGQASEDGGPPSSEAEPPSPPYGEAPEAERRGPESYRRGGGPPYGRGGRGDWGRGE